VAWQYSVVPYLDPRDDLRLHFEVVGTGQPLVLLHPAGVASSIWHDLGYVEQLSTAHELIMIDQIGFGRSTRSRVPGDYATAVQVANVEAVLDELGVAAANVFGYSMGATLVWGLVVLAPSRVERAVIGGSCPPGTRPPTPASYKPRVVTDQGLDVFIESTIARWRLEGIELSQRTIADLTSNDYDAVEARRDLVETPLEGRLADIDAPIHLVVGSDDPYCPAVRAHYSVVPGATHEVLEGRSHIGGLIDSTAMTTILTRFLGSSH
jgi:3-oxoadipate enol-lactonase